MDIASGSHAKQEGEKNDRDAAETHERRISSANEATKIGDFAQDPQRDAAVAHIARRQGIFCLFLNPAPINGRTAPGHVAWSLRNEGGPRWTTGFLASERVRAQKTRQITRRPAAYPGYLSASAEGNTDTTRFLWRATYTEGTIPP